MKLKGDAVKDFVSAVIIFCVCLVMIYVAMLFDHGYRHTTGHRSELKKGDAQYENFRTFKSADRRDTCR